MNSLNHDCLIEIVKLLNLKDQISVYQVNSSLQVAVATLWQIKLKHIRINFLEVSLTCKELAILLKNIQDTVETFHVRCLNKEKYEVFKEFHFERVTDFRFSLNKPHFMEDKDLKDLKRILPNLQVFSPHGNLTGLYMDEWPQLKQLNLSFCSNLDMLHFQTILKHLKLEKLKLNIFPNKEEFEQMYLADAQVENLKYLELNTYELYYFLEKPLTALKELIITNHYNPWQLFDVILSIWQAKSIRLVEATNVSNILVNCIEMHLNVEQLSVVSDENALPFDFISSVHLLTDLRKLRFQNCEIKTKNFINLLKNTPHLHEISFENCQFDSANICLNVGEIFTKRVGKLKLNMFKNRLIDNSEKPIWFTEMEEMIAVVVNVIGNANMLDLTHSKGDDLRYEPLYVIFR